MERLVEEAKRRKAGTLLLDGWVLDSLTDAFMFIFIAGFVEVPVKVRPSRSPGVRAHSGINGGGLIPALPGSNLQQSVAFNAFIPVGRRLQKLRLERGGTRNPEGSEASPTLDVSRC